MQPRLHRYFRRLAIKLLVVGLGGLPIGGVFFVDGWEREALISWCATAGVLIMGLFSARLSRHFSLSQRRRRQERRFAKYRESIKRRHEDTRVSTARANDLRHLRQLTRITVRELRYRRGHVSPNVLAATRAMIESNYRSMDFEQIYGVYMTITGCGEDLLHGRLSDLISNQQSA
jgi:hypothetical protein